jgi:hypothetical protein
MMREKALKIASVIGVKFDSYPVYRLELILSRNDGVRVHQLVDKINEIAGDTICTKTMIDKWYLGRQPRDNCIEILEMMYDKRGGQRAINLGGSARSRNIGKTTPVRNGSNEL